MPMLRHVPLLRHFLAVVRDGSLTAAAERLSVTQPALTKSIQRLEAELGVVLFDRMPRGVALTIHGRSLLPHAQRIDAECRLADLELRSFEKGHSGLLRVGAGHLFESTVVPTAIARVAQAYPGIRFKLVAGVTQTTYPMLLAGELDLTFGVLPPLETIPDYLRYRPVMELNQRVVAAADHPLVRRKDVGAGELARYPWVVMERDVAMVSALFATLTKEGPSAPRIDVEVTSLTSLVKLLQFGTHLSVFADAAKTLRTLDLSFVPYPGRLSRGQAGVVFHRSLERYEPAAMLVDVVRKTAPQTM